MTSTRPTDLTDASQVESEQVHTNEQECKDDFPELDQVFRGQLSKLDPLSSQIPEPHGALKAFWEHHPELRQPSHPTHTPQASTSLWKALEALHMKWLWGMGGAGVALAGLLLVLTPTTPTHLVNDPGDASTQSPPHQRGPLGVRNPPIYQGKGKISWMMLYAKAPTQAVPSKQPRPTKRVSMQIGRAHV